MSVIATDWGSTWSIVLVIAGAVVTVGGALVLLTDAGGRFLRWIRPNEPLVSIGHPEETATPFAFFGGSSDDFARQQRRYEALRLEDLGGGLRDREQGQH
jgi:hypothetical protein